MLNRWVIENSSFAELANQRRASHIRTLLLCSILIGTFVILRSEGKSFLSIWWSCYYRPQRSCGQGNVFTGVCDSVDRWGVCLSACWDTKHPPGADTPPEQTPPGADTLPPQSRHQQTPPGADSPPKEAGSVIWSMSGQYASYWNAFLLCIVILSKVGYKSRMYRTNRDALVKYSRTWI